MDSTTILEVLTETILYAFQFIVLLIGGGSLLFLMFCLGCAGSDFFTSSKRRTRQLPSSSFRLLKFAVPNHRLSKQPLTQRRNAS